MRSPVSSLRRSRVALVLLALPAALWLGACEPPEVDGDDLALTEGALRASDLRVDLALAKASYAAGEPVLATVTITNVSQHPVHLVPWFVPSADLEEPLFAVSSAGAAVPFRGPHFKRVGGGPVDHVTIAAGAALVRTVDLARFYDLTKSASYSFQAVLPLTQGKDDRVTSKSASAWVDAHAPAPAEPVTVTATAGTIGFSKCSPDQQTLVASAAAAANTMSDDAVSYLAGVPSATARYTTWFGTVSAARWDTAATHFRAIADAFDYQSLKVDCSCKKKNVYAYVYPNRPYTIYVCGAFWQAPMSGKDSKAGTLVHEMSHFDVTAQTDDWAYGQTACKSLAQTDPAKALDNADSHEYFAENAPALQ